MSQQEAKQDIVFLERRTRSIHSSTRVSREQPDRITSVDLAKGTWTDKFQGTHEIGRYVFGIGVYDISDIEQLQRMIDNAAEEHHDRHYIPDEYDE